VNAVAQMQVLQTMEKQKKWKMGGQLEKREKVNQCGGGVEQQRHARQQAFSIDPPIKA
jgi:hypothetical protein